MSTAQTLAKAKGALALLSTKKKIVVLQPGLQVQLQLRWKSSGRRIINPQQTFIAAGIGRKRRLNFSSSLV